MKRSIAALVISAAVMTAAPAFAFQGASAAGTTVNDYTPAQEQRARAVAARLGYQISPATMAQDGNFFFNGVKDGQTVSIIVTKEGQAYASTSIPAAPAAPAAAAPAAPGAPR